MINLATTTWLWPPLHLNLSAVRAPFSSDAPSYGSRRSHLPCAHASRRRSHEAVQVNEPDAVNRREVLHLLLLTISCQGIVETKQAIAEDHQEPSSLLTLEPYVDEKQGFTLMKPATWNKIDKAGATVLFEDPKSKGNNIGVVVNPVRISSLTEFGSIDIVADKLLQAEKKKPSTNDVQLLNVIEKQAHGGVPLYQVEYKLDSSRGVKRIFSAVTVAKKKLYILNVAFKDSSDMPLPLDTASLLNQIVNSFDLLS